ncbi:hypothetical protein ACFYOV_17620 [Streptomyces sp. NPDC005931]|uniref:hypothetical protein n=1 Tax=Streptomyces sp. NPDC005931 TaxID=3364737 RepID=UPI0036BEB54D
MALTRTPVRRLLDYAVLSVLAFVFALPALYLFLGSLKPSDEVLNGLSGFLPTHPPSTTTPLSSTASVPTAPDTSGSSWVCRCCCRSSW